jgi:flagellar basal body-associated protein FliL
MKSKLPMIGGGALVLLALAYFLVLPKLQGAPAAHAEEEEEEEEIHAKAPGLMYPISERVLNIAGAPGSPHYARIELAVEFKKPKGYKPPKAAGGGHGAPAKDAAPPLDPALEPVAHHQTQIDDALVRIIGAKTVEEMTSTEGKEHFKKELLAAVNELVGKPAATHVYIVRLIVQ